jgi:hypothetical protein
MTRIACLLSAFLFFFGSMINRIGYHNPEEWSLLDLTGAGLLGLFVASFVFPGVNQRLLLILRVLWGFVVILVFVAMI